jgi:hypothetical protein
MIVGLAIGFLLGLPAGSLLLAWTRRIDRPRRCPYCASPIINQSHCYVCGGALDQ